MTALELLRWDVWSFKDDLPHQICSQGPGSHQCCPGSHVDNFHLEPKRSNGVQLSDTFFQCSQLPVYRFENHVFDQDSSPNSKESKIWNHELAIWLGNPRYTTKSTLSEVSVGCNGCSATLC